MQGINTRGLAPCRSYDPSLDGEQRHGGRLLCGPFFHQAAGVVVCTRSRAEERTPMSVTSTRPETQATGRPPTSPAPDRRALRRHITFSQDPARPGRSDSMDLTTEQLGRLLFKGPVRATSQPEAIPEGLWRGRLRRRAGTRSWRSPPPTPRPSPRASGSIASGKSPPERWRPASTVAWPKCWPTFAFAWRNAASPKTTLRGPAAGSNRSSQPT